MTTIKFSKFSKQYDKQMDLISESRNKKRAHKLRILETPFWKLIICKIVGHTPDSLRDCECERCHLPIEAKVSWYVDQERLDNIL